jgi:hypothetical protein
LAQLAIAVPYCDAVVVEKFWKRALTETGLGQKYRTAVFSNLAELLPYVRSNPTPKCESYRTTSGKARTAPSRKSSKLNPTAESSRLADTHGLCFGCIEQSAQFAPGIEETARTPK